MTLGTCNNLESTIYLSQDMEVIMKKIIVILMVLFLFGCETDEFSYYQESLEKSDAVASGQSESTIQMDLEFSKSLRDENPEYEAFETINYSSTRAFDDGQSISRLYIGNDMIGLDASYYNDGSSEWVRIPFLGKFLSLDDLDFEMDESLYDKPPLSEEAMNQIAANWRRLAKEDDVVNLGDEVIDTPEGEVKVKKLVVSFSHEQVHTFLNTTLDILRNDSVFREEIVKYPFYMYEDGELKTYKMELTADELVDTYQQLVDVIIVDDFKMEVFIDIDQYVIQTTYEFKLSFTGFLADALNHFEVKGEQQLFDLHQDQILEFPELNEQNTITFDELLDRLGEFTIE